MLRRVPYMRLIASPFMMRATVVAMVVLILVTNAGASEPPCAFGDFPTPGDLLQCGIHLLEVLLGGNPYDY